MAKSKANVHKEEGDLQACPHSVPVPSRQAEGCRSPSSTRVCDTALVLGIAGNCLLKEAGGAGGHHPQAWMWLLALKAR